MASTYFTGNAVGSKDVRDLSDNASNFDEGMNSLSPSFNDRFLRRRQTWAGMETQFADFLGASALTYVADYTAGVNLTARNQYVIRSGIAYRAATNATLPIMLTGNWATDSAKLVAFNADATLGQNLGSADPALGASLVAGAMRVASTIAELRALPKTGSKRVFVTSYWGELGKGGGHYALDAADTSTLDNGGTVIVATDGGRWKLVHSGVLSVMQFGAKGDNAFDDSVPCQACIDVLVALGGGTILFPTGTYNFQSKRTAGLTPYAFEDPNLFFKDARNIHVKGTGRSIVTNSAYPANRAEQMLFYRCSDITVEGIIFQGNNTGMPNAVNNCGIGLLSCKNMTIKENVLTGFQGSYIASSWLFDSLIMNNRFDVLGGSGIDSAFWQNVAVIYNDFNGNGLGNNGLGTQGMQCAYDTPNINRNETGVAWRLASNNVTFEGNSVVGFATGLLMADMFNSKIVNNDFNANFISADSQTWGCVITNTDSTNNLFPMVGMTVSNNRFTRNGSSGSGGGLTISKGTAAAVEIDLLGNEFQDNSHIGLQAADGVVLRGKMNKFRNVFTVDQSNSVVFGTLGAGSLFTDNPGYNPFPAAGLPLPAGIGSGSAVTNNRPFGATIYQTGGTGIHLVSAAGVDTTIMPGNQSTIRIEPYGKIYFATANTSAWTWVFD